MISFDNIITNYPPFLKTIENAKKIATSDMNILITGENGVGKTQFAKAIHNHSNRKNNTFIIINCFEIPDNLLEYNQGTIYLNEIGNMPQSSQDKLLETIENKQMNNIDIKIISSTTRDLTKLAKEGFFREDLYCHLNEVNFHIPDLKSRREDISLLIKHFIEEFNLKFNKKVEGVSNIAMGYLLNYDWPGNIRELRNTIKTAVALSDKNTIWLEGIPLKISLTNENIVNNIDESSFSLKHSEKEHILKILTMCRWNKSKAAKLLEISRPRLDRKINEFEIKRP